MAYFNLNQGIDGRDIFLALVDLGLKLDKVENELAKLDLNKLGIDIDGSFELLDVNQKSQLKAELENKELEYLEVKELISNSSLEDKIKNKGLVIIKDFFKTKNKAPVWEVIQLLFFTIGILIGIYSLHIEKIYASAICIGNYPKRDVLEMLKGCTTFSNSEEQELVTEIGAAIIINLVDKFGEQPKMILGETGYGVVSNQDRIELRITLGELKDIKKYSQDEIITIEANIDDMNQEFYDYIIDRLLEEGALDVYLTSIQMKKNRPAQKLTVLINEEDLNMILKVIFTETTTLGVRINKQQRYKLNRRFITVKVGSQEVRVKLGYIGNQTLNIAPEYDSCKEVAIKTGISLSEVYHQAIIEAKKFNN